MDDEKHKAMEILFTILPYYWSQFVNDTGLASNKACDVMATCVEVGNRVFGACSKANHARRATRALVTMCSERRAGPACGCGCALFA